MRWAIPPRLRYIETVARRGYRFVATIDGFPDRLDARSSGGGSEIEASPEQPVKSRTWRALPAAAMVVPIAAVLVYSFSRQPAPDIPRLRFSIEAPEDVAFTNIYGGAAISPTAHSWRLPPCGCAGSRATLWIRPIDALVPRELPGTQGAQTIFWSADSKSIASSPKAS
jgi:hypothetical protein